MEKLRIEKKDIYEIEVNDEGETIEFDLRDINLPDKAIKTAKNLKKENDFLQNRVKALTKQYQDNKELLVEKVDEANKIYYKKARAIFDEFLGEGACMKIFGATDRIGMFEDLFDALEPHFDKMKINIKAIKEDLVKKYSPKSKEVL